MIVDIVLLVVVGYGFYMGFSNGIIKTIFTILSIMFGILATVNFSSEMTDFLQGAFSTRSPIMPFVGILATFVIAMVILRLIGRQIENLFRSANINFINQLVGGVVMGFLFIVLYSVLVWFFMEAGLLDEQIAESRTYPYLKSVPARASVVWKQVSPSVQDFWFYLKDAFEQLDGDKVRSIDDSFHIDDFGGREREIIDSTEPDGGQ